MSDRKRDSGIGARIGKRFRADYPDVEIYLGESHGQMRTALRSALRDIRLNVHEDYEECEPLRQALRDGNADMVIVDADLAGGDARNLIEAIRFAKLGPNPFVPVIVTSWQNDAARLRQLIDSGVDGLLVKPTSVQAIQSHIDTIIYRRKPFVVTSSYIGPDRRVDPAHTSDIRLIDVPNTLLSKVRGDRIDPVALQKEIANVLKTVNSERLRRNAFELSFLIQMIIGDYSDSEKTARTGRLVERLRMVIQDTADRLLGTPFEHNSGICQSLLRVAESIAVDYRKAASKDIALLKPLSDAVLLSFNPERSASDLAREIATSIDQFKSRTPVLKEPD
ncbi:MAG: response regulator [Alphaproteobacteria bacterium]